VPSSIASPIRVLVVDDSAFMRKVIANMLGSDPRITVAGVARHGEEALAQVRALKPDVMTLDIEMPGMNGIEVLRRVMEEMPLPVIMVSSLTEEGAKETLTALDLGAVDYIPKHLQGSAVNILGIQHDLIEKVIAAHRVGARLAQLTRKARETGRPAGRPIPPNTVSVGRESVKPSASAGSVFHARGSKVVAIGCSTGGPKALQEIFPLFPKDFPAAILVVQHMPKFFTGPFAQRLNQVSEIEVREAVDGDVPEPGLALIAPGGLHMRVARRSATEVAVRLSAEPVTLHMPSVDEMMTSVAQVFSGRAVGVILTGMGNDGHDGMKAIRAAQGRTIAQDEASCVIYSMPKGVVDSGLADKIVPLDKIAGEIANMV
jgi:two-component system chemotaxis response regulator CheB